MTRKTIKAQDLVDIAVECIKHPRYKSFWSPLRRRYVCPETEKLERNEAVVDLDSEDKYRSLHKPAIDPQFKLVFLTSATGTGIFILLCVVLSLVAGREPPPLFEKIILSLFDLAKIGFGAIVGLLGGQALQSRDDN